MWDPPRPGIQPVSCIGRWIPHHWATREALEMFWILTVLVSRSWLWYCLRVLQDVIIGGPWVQVFFLCIIFFFFLSFIFKLYNIVLVLPNIKMNPPQVYLCSPSWTLFPPPSPVLFLLSTCDSKITSKGLIKKKTKNNARRNVIKNNTVHDKNSKLESWLRDIQSKSVTSRGETATEVFTTGS